ncbi:MAG: hypothetical protein HY901_36670 [Deltaproteobacteria bacterium]|nr:hypothetical protein [Deltaproteobacteria bacterium]
MKSPSLRLLLLPGALLLLVACPDSTASFGSVDAATPPAQAGTRAAAQVVAGAGRMTSGGWTLEGQVGGTVPASPSPSTAGDGTRLDTESTLRR